MSGDLRSREGEPLPQGAHEWYWGNGRPCCVNCGALARCEHQYERNRQDFELREKYDQMRETVRRMVGALEIASNTRLGVKRALEIARGATDA